MALDLDIKGLASKLRKPGGGSDTPSTETQIDSAATARPRSSAPMSTRLSGDRAVYDADLKPYLPTELVGGSIPFVPGMEDEAVWNAASQSCATEKVHYVYTVEDNRIWYLACPSSALASSPDSWCPLAAALPGNSEYWDRETVYMFEQEGIASALRWDQETHRMQIFLGASRTILPRIQSMEANFVTINPQIAKPVPWVSRQLMTERLSRATARMLLVSGIVISLGLLFILAGQYVMVNLVDRKLEDVRASSDAASMDLMIKASQATQSEVMKAVIRLQELLDDLSKIDGTLVKFEVKGSNITWEALVPAAYAKGIMSVRGDAQPGIEPDGRIRLKGNG